MVIMKKIFLKSGMLLMLPLLFTSCEKEKPLSEELIGSWRVESVTQVTYEDNIKKSATTYYLESDELMIQFIEGGTGTLYTENNPMSMFTWIINGVTASVDVGDEIMEWDIIIEDDVLTWSFFGPQQEAKSIVSYEYIYTARRTN